MEIRLEDSENIHHLVKIQIPNSLRGLVNTKIGPVLQVKVIGCLDQYGMEVQAPSTSRDGSKSWIIMYVRPKPLR